MNQQEIVNIDKIVELISSDNEDNVLLGYTILKNFSEEFRKEVFIEFLCDKTDEGNRSYFKYNSNVYYYVIYDDFNSTLSFYGLVKGPGSQSYHLGEFKNSIDLKKVLREAINHMLDSNEHFYNRVVNIKV